MCTVGLSRHRTCQASRQPLELHEGHVGRVNIKCLSRNYTWWPGIDHQIKDVAKSCHGCQETQRTPRLSPVQPWECPPRRRQRLHIDFARPFFGKMFLVIVDAHSKWSKVIPMTPTTAPQSVEVLRSQFA